MRVAIPAGLLVGLFLVLCASGTILARSDFYYRSIVGHFEINADKTISTTIQFELVNPSYTQWLTGITWTVPCGISDVRAWDSQGDLRVSTENLGTSTKISVKFRSAVYGNMSLRFWLSYKMMGVVKGGKFEYRCNLGAISAQREIQDYEVWVKGPSSTELFLASPEAELEDGWLKLRTSLQQGEACEGLTAVYFSTPAFYTVTLTEKIQNQSSKETTVMFHFLLFNNSQGQFAALYNCSHPIRSLWIDEENNWYADVKLDLPPYSQTVVQLKCFWFTDIYKPEVDTSNAGSITQISDELAPYLKEQEWWEVSSPQIQSKAWEVSAGETNVYRLAKRIVRAVGDLLTYQQTPERQGALQTLLRGYGDCDGYSDLTIALARASGLPARLCFGWACQESEYKGHAWVEFYSPTLGWLPSDPTWAEEWGNYLFCSDPSHLLRGIRGLSSSDSSVRMEYFGSAPTIQEEVEITPTDNSTIFGLALQACSLYLGVCENLVGSQDPVLQAARSHYQNALALGSLPEALDCIQCCGTIISLHGEESELSPRFLLQLPIEISLEQLLVILLIILVIVTVVAVSR